MTEENPASVEELEAAYGGGRREMYQRIRNSGLTLHQVSEIVGGAGRRDLVARARNAGLDTKDFRELAKASQQIDA